MNSQKRTLIQKVLQFFHDLTRFEIYTDGSSKDGWGSWAYVITKRGKLLRESSGRVRRGQSHVMEFQAAIEALHSMPEKSKAVVYSDCRILVDAMTLGKGPEVLKEQTEKLRNLGLNRQITWKWIKAHHGIKFNERCDELCLQARLKKT